MTISMNMNAEALDPRAAIDQFFTKKLTGTQLLRHLTLYSGWQIPARLEGLVPNFTDYKLGTDATHFLLFSDKDAYLQCRNTLGIPIMGEYYIGNVSGHKAFAAIGSNVTVVNINPYSPQEIHYTKEQIPRLKSWSKIIQAERALDEAGKSRAGYSVIREFGEYYFIMEDEQFIALAPDGRGRKLAALFTADDALDLFLARNGKPNMRPVPIAGEALFDAIRKMPLHGMVFNCSGPTKPKVFPLAFALDIVNYRE